MYRFRLSHKRTADVVDMAEHEFQNYRMKRQHQEHMQRDHVEMQPSYHEAGHALSALTIDDDVNDFELGQSYTVKTDPVDVQSPDVNVNPFFHQNQSDEHRGKRQMDPNYDPVLETAPQNGYHQHSNPNPNPPFQASNQSNMHNNNGSQAPRVNEQRIPMIRKRKKRKRRDQNGQVMYDQHGNVIYEYKWFKVPDPNYNPNQPASRPMNPTMPRNQQQINPQHNVNHQGHQRPYDSHQNQNHQTNHQMNRNVSQQSQFDDSHHHNQQYQQHNEVEDDPQHGLLQSNNQQQSINMEPINAGGPRKSKKLRKPKKKKKKKQETVKRAFSISITNEDREDELVVDKGIITVILSMFSLYFLYFCITIFLWTEG